VSRYRYFYGWRVVGAAFVLAVFGWGLGFYGPPIYLDTVCRTHGWPVALVGIAVTVHYLAGAIVVASLPALYRRFGVPAITKSGAVALALGVSGWALAAEPWQLFVATLLSGAGWVTLAGAALNTIVSPWFNQKRPAALSAAYNGSSIGGIIFSPVWVAAIGLLGFPGAAAAIGLVTVVTVWLLADLFFAKSPGQMGLLPDGEAPAQAVAPTVPAVAPSRPARLRSNRKFLTLAAGMSLGLFAQIGLLAHLYSLLVPALGRQNAGLAIGGATAAAIAGRTLVSRLIAARSDRRLFACASYVVQIVGAMALLAAAGTSVPLLLAGVVLFGAGIGNATSLPPLIAQTEFAAADVARVVPMILAVAQACYAFAPATFGLIRQLHPGAGSAGVAPQVFVAAALIQAGAILALWLGRFEPRRRSALAAEPSGQ
jgi:hypothetical protein